MIFFFHFLCRRMTIILLYLSLLVAIRECKKSAVEKRKRQLLVCAMNFVLKIMFTLCVFGQFCLCVTFLYFLKACLLKKVHHIFFWYCNETFLQFYIFSLNYSCIFSHLYTLSKLTLLHTQKIIILSFCNNTKKKDLVRVRTASNLK